MRPVTFLAFWGGLLLFVLELLVGRLLLPQCGGGAHVWLTSLMFFQGVLLLAYVYCYQLLDRIGGWHLVLAGVGLLFLPVSIVAAPDPATPVPGVLWALARYVGVPFFVLATTSVAAQIWASGSGREAHPYRLYAASNVGSMVGLLLVPFVLEPVFGLTVTGVLWSIGFLIYGVLLVLSWRATRPSTDPSSAKVSGAPAGAPVSPEEPASIGTNGEVLFWLACAAGPSALLLAISAELSRDIGNGPAVWVAPLALYLLSFVIAFRDPYLMPAFLRRHWVEIAVVGVFLQGQDSARTYALIQLATLFVVSSAAHRALYRSRPASSHLARFYIAIALGGWLGAAFVSLLAPHLFDSFVEYPIAVIAVVATLVLGRREEIVAALRREPRILTLASVLFVLAAGFAFANRTSPFYGEVRAVHRNAYGRYVVVEQRDRLVLFHGTTVHGTQGFQPALRHRASGYYAAESPVGDVFRHWGSPKQVAVIGLGAGTMGALRGPGDRITFLEIDPDVERLAREHFTYLEDCGEACDVVVGDGRRWLVTHDRFEQGLDVLVVDAFTSDAIPTHLLTVEAIDEFVSQLAPDGVLVYHISNRHLDLRPVLDAAAGVLGLEMSYRSKNSGLAELEDPSTWVALHRDPHGLDRLNDDGWVAGSRRSEGRAMTAWTDDRIPLFRFWR